MDVNRGGGGEMARRRIDAEVGTWPLTRVTPGHRLHAEVPATDRLNAATECGRELEGRARSIDVETVVVAGDVWARGILNRRLPASLRRHVTTVEGAGEPSPGRALLQQQLDGLFEGRIAAHEQALLNALLAGRAHGGAAAEGLAAAVSALQRGQVKALFLNNHPESPLRLWVGQEPGQIALTEQELRSYGIREASEERADAALARALVGPGGRTGRGTRAEAATERRRGRAAALPGP
ncbi:MULTISPECIES: hypothetical protein [unclassified Streptomyces]|uniref:baeRF2 domain-containing protein n=1 Tax=unclassified Streptomyces TaxID=2593676 RepID=UPI00145EC73A|nr:MULTISPECIES: hypothetical protein [unclassified Streptomyces]